MKTKNFRSVGWCEVHGRHLYTDRGRAKQVARQHTDHKNVYRCSVNDGLWHVGTLDPRVIHGEYTRDYFYRDAA